MITKVEYRNMRVVGSLILLKTFEKEEVLNRLGVTFKREKLPNHKIMAHDRDGNGEGHD